MSRARVLAAALFLVLLPQIAAACPVCFGAAGDPLNKGASNGILFLLAVIGMVQLGFVALFWSFWRRAKQGTRRGKQWRLIRGGLDGSGHAKPTVAGH